MSNQAPIDSVRLLNSTYPNWVPHFSLPLGEVGIFTLLIPEAPSRISS